MKKIISNKKEKETSLDNKMIYTGKVNISFTRGGKVIKKTKGKNAGTNFLFSFLAQCLGGDFNEGSRPKFIKMLNTSSNNITESYIPFSNITIEGTVVKFKFLIPFSSLKSGETVSKLQLFNDSRELLADYDIPTAEQYTLGSGESVVIEWELEISN